MTAEQSRLNANALKEVPLEKWGPYLSERQWGTVREDYSVHGDAWSYFTHDQSRSRTYRWGEDGLAGISDMHQNLCFAMAMWNGKDTILKERLFGLTNSEGNHGEDVKELYYYLDNIPTHYYMEYLYKYPQEPFPYDQLLEENRKRSKTDGEFELLDTGIFKNNKYFDVKVIYAKIHEEDICIEVRVTNHAEEMGEIILLPTLWFRNRWLDGDLQQKPELESVFSDGKLGVVQATHEILGTYYFYFEGTAETLMTENETNRERIFGTNNPSPFVKDAFQDAIAENNNSIYQALRTNKRGTKFAPVFRLNISPGETSKIKLRISTDKLGNPFNETFDGIFIQRKMEADEFYEGLAPSGCSEDIKGIQRQALAGLLWTKQFYQYDVEQWLEGDPGIVLPPKERENGRNANWKHLKIADVLSMPDKWEYPWFAAWDLCFHCIPMAMVDPVFAKNQLILLCREWFMNPFGQIPAYEWNFSDVNPPIQAWAALQIYKIEKEVHHHADIHFLKRIFEKLMINFTWWANREDENENNVFTGGFLGLDNIGVIDRDSLPPGVFLEQVDATAWMGMFALSMMEIALEIVQTDSSYEDMVTKFYEHFVLIASSLNDTLWDDNDNFFYDRLHLKDGSRISMKVRSMVGLSVLFNVGIISRETLENLPDFKKRMDYIRSYRLRKNKFLPCQETSDEGHILITLLPKGRMEKLLAVMFDENEFLSNGGIRAMSKFHQEHPFILQLGQQKFSVWYQPGESQDSMFGGNSNWRGPVWMPLNFLIINTLRELYSFYGDEFKVSFPTNTQNKVNLAIIYQMLSDRILSSFQQDKNYTRPVHGDENWFYQRLENRNLLQFYEYYHGDTAQGLGASHQTGWSSLIATLINTDLAYRKG